MVARHKWCLILPLLLATLSVGCLGVIGSPNNSAQVRAVAGEWWRFFPVRYGNARNSGGGFLGIEGCFVESPDGGWRVILVRSAERSGHELHISRQGDNTSKMLFSAAALEPDPISSILSSRAVWAGDSTGIYATVMPEEAPQYAQTFFIDLNGTTKAIPSPTWVGTNTVSTPVEK